MKKIIVPILIIVSLVVYFLNRQTEDKPEYIPVIESIKDMKSLICTSYYEEYAQIKDKSNLIFDDKLVVIYKITLRSGFDLTKIKEEDIVISNDSVITFILPSPEILQKHCNPSDKKIFHSSGCWSDYEMSKFHKEAISEVYNHAIEENILETTKSQGVQYFSRLFESFGFQKDNIHIIFR